MKNVDKTLDDILFNKYWDSGPGKVLKDFGDIVVVTHNANLKKYDFIRIDGTDEVMLINSINGRDLVVSRGWGSTIKQYASGKFYKILGNYTDI